MTRFRAIIASIFFLFVGLSVTFGFEPSYDAFKFKAWNAGKSANRYADYDAIGNWNTAFAWGNHADFGYLTDLAGFGITDLGDVTITAPASGDWLQYDGSMWTNTPSGASLGNLTANSPLSFNNTRKVIGGAAAVSIANAKAEGITKGAATFWPSDFNDDGAGSITIDYTNGQEADGSTKGFLAAADWTIFNDKVSTARTISTTAPITGGGDLSANRTIAIPVATASVNGYLASTDWTTFNSKQAGDSDLTDLAGLTAATGDLIYGAGTGNWDKLAVGVGATVLHGGTTPSYSQVVTADVATNNITDGLLRQGVARSVIGVTGNATANEADIQGAADQVLRVNSAGTALAFGTAAIAGGGTGQVTANAGYNALSPMTTLGDIEYEAAGPIAARLAGNTTSTKKFLRQTGTGTVSAAPAWDTLVAGDVPDLSSTYQPLDSDLTYLAGFTPTANIKTILNAADYSAVRTALGLVIGTDVQAYDADLGDLAGLSAVQGDLIVGGGAGDWQKFPKDANATRYLSNTGTSNQPAWAQVALATGVSGTLPVANLPDPEVPVDGTKDITGALSIVPASGTGLTVQSAAAGNTAITLRNVGNTQSLWSAGESAAGVGFTDWRNGSGTLLARIHVGADSYYNGTGNFGIGTTGPDRALDVLRASAPQLRLTYTDGSVYTDFKTDSGGNLIITPSAAPTTGKVLVSDGTNFSASSGTFSGSSSGTNTGDQTIPAAANPTATLTSSLQNGVATTWMRSDGAPALPQTLSTAGTPQFAGLGLGNAAASTVGDYVRKSWADPAATVYDQLHQGSVVLAASSANRFNGVMVNDTFNLNGFNNTSSTITFPGMRGFYSTNAITGATGTMSNAVGIGVGWSMSGGNTTANFYGIALENPAVSGGSTLTNNYALHIASQTAGGTKNYGVFQAGTGGLNVLAGNTRIGATTDPTIALDVTGAIAATTTITGTGITNAGNGVMSGDRLEMHAGSITSTAITGGATDYMNIEGVALSATRGIVMNRSGSFTKASVIYDVTANLLDPDIRMAVYNITSATAMLLSADMEAPPGVSNNKNGSVTATRNVTTFASGDLITIGLANYAVAGNTSTINNVIFNIEYYYN